MRFLALVASLLASITSIAQTEWGCTDPSAANYNPAATADNGTCCYDGVWYEVYASEAVYFSFYNDQLGYLGAAEYPSQTGVCIPDVCTSVNVHGTLGTGNYNWSVSNAQGIELAGGTTVDNFYDYAIITPVNSVSGCLDPMACNFDANATCYDYTSCDYSCWGCTNPQSFNYDPAATIDDGSCCSAANYLTGMVSGTTDDQGIYWYLTSLDGSYSYSMVNGTALCVPEGCYFISIYSPVYQGTAQFTFTDGNGEVVFSQTIETPYPITFTMGDGTPGCGDPYACNYAPDATCLTYSLCTYDCYGCTNPQAANYDSTATLDNGSCCTQSYTISGTGEFQYNVSNYLTGYSTGGIFPGSTGFCLPDGCFNLDLWSVSSENFEWTLTDASGQVIVSGANSYYYASQSFSNNASIGCLDPYACNYDVTATCSDYSMCSYDCYGCTDPTASNFDPDAVLSSNTCCYASYYEVELSAPGYWYAYSSDGSSGGSGHYPETTGFCFDEGCLYFSAYPDDYSLTDFSASISLNDTIVTSGNVNPIFGGVELTLSENPITGCNVYYACNYDPTANCPDYYACDFSCYGCTNASAPNYNPDATIDDGTCCYNDWYTLEFGAPAYWSITSLTDYTYSTGNYPEQNGFCITGTCFQLSAWSYDGTDLSYTIYDAAGNIIDSGTIGYYEYAVTVAFNGVTLGCADPSACNYDSSAECMDYLNCDYSCLGCTDPTAPNYNPSATQNDGSCCYNNWYSMSASEEFYWYIIDANFNYFGGIYPAQNGFCTLNDCFTMQVYSLTGNPIELEITNENGVVLYSGIANSTNYYELISISNTAEVAGCTDPSACNYNAEATCDDGSCNLCIGCTNPSALNYDAWAWYDDGTCIYEMVPPFMGMTMLPDEANNQFWVSVEMMDAGNGAPYVLSTSFDNQMMVMTQPGQYLAGPYPCDATIDFTLQSMEAGMMEYMNASMDGNCAIAQSVTEMEASFTLYPNPANDRVTISGWDTNASVTITDISGRVIRQEQLRSNQIDTAMLTEGIYVVSLTEGTKTASKRLVIQH